MAGVAVRPRLWVTALRQVRRLAPPRWWARPPFLPVPGADYLAFRFETHSGAAEPEAHDVVAYLEWCRAMERVVERARSDGGRPIRRR